MTSGGGVVRCQLAADMYVVAERSAERWGTELQSRYMHLQERLEG